MHYSYYWDNSSNNRSGKLVEALKNKSSDTEVGKRGSSHLFPDNLV